MVGKVTGKRIREIRKSKNISIVEFANMVGVSKSLISQVERGDIFPSLSTLEKIAIALEVDISQFFKIESSPPISEAEIVVRGNKRKKITMPNSSMIYNLLTPNLRKSLEFLLIEIPPFSSRSEEEEIETFKHGGEEYFFVLEGQLELVIGEQKYIINAGDSGCFDSSHGHIWRNDSDKKGAFIIAATSPTL
ncbi:MAG: XRE family transcriptional regulator [Dehalobacterium sp.]